MFSIYTSLYNLDNGFIDWKGAISNHSCFADQLVISTLPKDFEILKEHIQNFLIERGKVRLVNCEDISLNDPFFDGKIKNEALKHCTQPYCILLDGDERINKKDRPMFETIAKHKNADFDACLIPVLDLYNSEKEYKSLGQKWYLHQNKPNIQRGVVNFARKGNYIDTNKSDSCELIYDNGELVKSFYLVNPGLSDSEKLQLIKDYQYPVIYHLGWLDKQKRLKSNDFWQKVWDARAGEKVDNIIHSEEQLNKIQSFSHGLKLWYE